MSYKWMFNERLICLDMEGGDLEQLFEKVAKQLMALGFVNENYLEGLSTREKAFPTGLITQYLNIALPHSDPEFIEKPFVYVVRLKKEVVMKQMGDSQEMKVKNFFFLGIKDPAKQVGLLQSFMTLFMDEPFVKAFMKAEETNTVYQLFTKNIN